MPLGRSGAPSPHHKQKTTRGPGFGFGFASLRGWVIRIQIRNRFRNQTEFRRAARNFCIVSEVRFLLPHEPFTVKIRAILVQTQR
jgi:hypothetical protein